jgi:formate-dependent nitrite reductase membrane component NrfD
MPSDTYFTQSPEWGWLIALYFWFGGISAGAYVFAAILDIFGKTFDRAMARLGYMVSFVALIFCPPLLIIDLTRPERFWHMMIQNNTGGLMLKTYSPMSLGVWGLFLFGIFATAAFLGAIGETTKGPLRGFAFLGRDPIRKVIAALGTIPGFFVAGYTGVLLSVTNRPIWADTSMLGGLFLLSGATVAASVLIWLGHKRAHPASVEWMSRLSVKLVILEVILLVLTIVTLGPVAREWMGKWGLVLIVGVLFGLLAPMYLHLKPRLLGAQGVAVAAMLALAGGLLVRILVIFSSEAI